MSPLRKVFGETLEKARQCLGYSRERLSSITFIDAQSIRNYEKGDRWPDPEIIEALAGALKQPVESLFAGTIYTSPKPSPEEALKVIAEALGNDPGSFSLKHSIASDLRGNLMRIASSLDEKQLGLLISYAEGLISGKLTNVSHNATKKSKGPR